MSAPSPLDFFSAYAIDCGLTVVADAAAAPARPVAPNREVVAASPEPTPFRHAPFRGAYGWHSRETYRRMNDCPAVGASFDTIRATVLSGKCDLIPATDFDAAEGLGQVAADDLTAAEAALCQRIAASNARMLHLWETPLDLVLWEMMESLYLGHVIPERTYADVEGGPDDGLWSIRSIKPKDGCRFRVDRAMNVIGIDAPVVGDDGTVRSQTMSPDHFPYLSWNTYRGDPRGRSIYQRAVPAWERLEELWPDAMKGWKQFGVPMVVGTLPPNAQMIPAAQSGDKPTSPTDAMAWGLMGLRNGSTLAIDHGATVEVVESNKDSSIIAGALEALEAQIIKSLVLTTRATTEARFGSRADSETAQDVFGTLVRFLRKWLERYVRSLLTHQNSLNYGPDVARRCTPLVDLGSTEHQDFAQNAAGVAALYQAGYFKKKQLKKVDAKLDLPMRDDEDADTGPQVANAASVAPSRGEQA